MSASSVNIGQIVGCLLGGYCGGRFGPKRTILASCVPAALGWIIIASSPHLATLILGRVLCGIAGCFMDPNCSLLVARYRFIFLLYVTVDCQLTVKEQQSHGLTMTGLQEPLQA